ncbi:MAG TPA: DUF4340 domain-containing protein, partial [Vicinamibacterales bacterium]|nr:DUF4340 domain-containing protein [Vicinamibacterales bacterium]
VVFVGLVAYIYFVDSKKPASDAPETKAKAFTVDADQIEEIHIKPASGDASRVQKANGTWQLIEPEKAEADQGQVSNAATSLATLEISRVVDDNPSDLSQYGLNPPKAEITFRAKGQKDTHQLLLGEKTATGSDLYAKTPDQKRVFLISGYLENTFERTPFDLRDKAALKFDQSKADGIEIVHDGTIALAKSGSEWAVTKPYKARADFAGAEAVLTSLSSLQMQKIVENDAKDLAKYGLDKPDATITVNGGSTRASLALGKKDGDAVYARDLSRPIVFTIPATAAADLEKDAGALRRKDMFDGRSFNATRVELKRGGETLSFDKSKGKDGKDVWKNAAGKDVDAAKVEDMLTKLSNVRAQLFQDRVDPVLKMPTLVATLKLDNNMMETVTFARSGNAVLASREGEPGSATVEVMAFNDAMSAIDAVK